MILVSLLSIFIYFMYVYCIISLLNLYSSCQYVFMVRVSVEGFDVPKVIPRMATLSNVVVRKHIAVCKAMGCLGCGEVCMDMICFLLNRHIIIIQLSVRRFHMFQVFATADEERVRRCQNTDPCPHKRGTPTAALLSFTHIIAPPPICRSSKLTLNLLFL